MNPEAPHTGELITSESIPKAPMEIIDDLDTEPLPRFLIGDKVTVQRSGVDGAAPTLEHNWSVAGYDSETGKVIVTSPDKTLEKRINPDRLEALQPQAPFKVGEQVFVKRNSYDTAGKRIPGEFAIEAGWKVESIDHETGTVVVGSPDGQAEKTYSFDMLKDLQPQHVIGVESIPSTPELSGEERQEIQQEMAEEAIEDAGILAVDAAARIANLAPTPEQKPADPYDYLRTKLPPVVRPVKETKAADYDRMLSGDTQDQPWAQPNRGFGHYEPETEEDKQRKYYDRFVTEGNKQEALGTLSETLKATPEIGEILSRYGISSTSIDAVDAIRENPDVRFEVAKVLTQKLDRLAADPNNDMGWRINQNSLNNLKADSITGEKMLSRLYAVKMALKMIGGEFSTRHEGSDPIDRDESGSVAIGQHRHAATSTLMTRI